MKGISDIIDKKNRKTAIVIDLKLLEKNQEEVHEYIDVLIAESRKHVDFISWDEAKKHLHQKHKI